MVFCCIPRCPSSRTVDPSISFHAFPTNPDIAANWIKNVNLHIPSGGTWFPQAGNVVCCKHFLPTDFKPESRIPSLKPGSVPTVFQMVSSPSSDVGRKSKVETKSPLIVKVIKPTLESEDDSDDMDMDDVPLSEMLKLPTHSDVMPRVKALLSSHSSKVGLLQSNIPTKKLSTPLVKSYSKTANLSPHKNEQGIQTVTPNIPLNSNKSTKDNVIDHHRPEDKENEQIVKKAKLSNIKQKKKHSEADLIEIGPSTFLKINPDVIKVTKKATPSGNTVLQFVMNPKLGLDASKIFQTTTKSTNATTLKLQNPGAIQQKQAGDKVDETCEGNLENTNLAEGTECDSEDPNDLTSGALINGEDSGGEGYQQLAPVILSTNLPVNNTYSFSLQQKYSANIRQKNRQIQLLKIKLDKLMKKVDEFETKCIVQERQLDFPNIKKLRIIKKNAARGEPHANFIFEQIRGYNVNVPIRWSDSTMTQCSVWCRKAPYAYEYFKKADLFRLPCVGTVKRFMKKHPEITTQIKNRTIQAHKVDSDDSSSDFEFDDEEREEEDTNNEDSVSSTSNMPCETILHVSPGLTDENSQAVEMILPTSDSIATTTNTHIILQSSTHLNQAVDLHGKVSGERNNDASDTCEPNNAVTEEIIVESTSSDQVKNIYIHPNQDGGITTLNVNGQEIILQPGNIIQLNSDITGIEGMENQYFVIPAADDHIAGEEHQIGNGQPVSFVIQDGDNEEQIIYIAEHPTTVTDIAASLTD